MEIIFETLIILILRYPGAGIRWLFSRLWKSDKKFNEFLKEYAFMNGVISLLIIAAIVLGIKNIIQG